MDLNKVTIIGRLGQDPETRFFQDGGSVTNLRVATSESWKDKSTGEKKERTEWHRVSIFGKLAEIADEYLRKGSQVYLEGKLQTRKWQDKDGNDRYTTEIKVDGYDGKLIMLGGGSGSRQRDDRKEEEEDDDRSDRGSSSQSDAFDDDIPF